jgi:hypothetical protein
MASRRRGQKAVWRHAFVFTTSQQRLMIHAIMSRDVARYDVAKNYGLILGENLGSG